MTTLLASAARTASGTFVVPTPLPAGVLAGVFQLLVSAAATDVGDTLDVYIQHSVDGGTTWDDFIHFTQVLGNGGAKTFIARWNPIGAAPESELGAPQDAAMSAGVLQQPIGPNLRVKWAITDAGTDNASFTFGVEAAFTKLRS